MITSLLVGILILFLLSIKLSRRKVEVPEQVYDIVMAPEEIVEDKDLASATPNENTKIETNRAYNEAEKYISSIESENRDVSETTEGKLQEMEQAIENSELSASERGNISTAKPKKGSDNFSNGTHSKKEESVNRGANRNTTISYRLVNRQDMYLPNPVYTCYGSGKIVITIEVDDQGNVKNAVYNKSASTTANQCLIEAAIEYSLQAKFTSDASKKKQLGSITYNFPGQG